MDIDTYTSPFSTRYGGSKLRGIWSEGNKRWLWRTGWVNLLREQFGDTVAILDLQEYNATHGYTVEDYQLAMRYEADLGHDLVAERAAFCETAAYTVCDKIHAGATSSDIEDYAEYRQVQESVEVVTKMFGKLLQSLLRVARETRYIVTMGKTHLQPAEPTLLGNRFYWYFEQISLFDMYYLTGDFYEKGIRGAVGSNANTEIVGTMGRRKLTGWGFGPALQTRSRVQDVKLAAHFAGIASVLAKMCLDIRLMQSDGVLFEKKRGGQVGSSAMPGKSNPITAEKVCGLSRMQLGYHDQLWHCAANTALERTLDDSSVRRAVLPEMFLCISEILTSSTKLLDNLEIGDPVVQMQRVMDGWKSWLPSRVLATWQKSGSCADVLTAHQDLEKFLGTASTPEMFLRLCGIFNTPPISMVGLSWLEENLVGYANSCGVFLNSRADLYGFKK